ncbi:hypothetical protein C8N32_10125 [Rhodovulum imhoffii]|uniref:Uncharacterized protein n=1 Tax=Rhodovulum imhoffii TaxID=365340 RepID=A0A2T5BW16_9RHOB|nr:hypothetical protein C8N32_10125 [Rhodovulum imhoffii]
MSSGFPRITFCPARSQSGLETGKGHFYRCGSIGCQAGPMDVSRIGRLAGSFGSVACAGDLSGVSDARDMSPARPVENGRAPALSPIANVGPARTGESPGQVSSEPRTSLVLCDEVSNDDGQKHPGQDGQDDF